MSDATPYDVIEFAQSAFENSQAFGDLDWCGIYQVPKPMENDAIAGMPEKRHVVTYGFYAFIWSVAPLDYDLVSEWRKGIGWINV